MEREYTVRTDVDGVEVEAAVKRSKFKYSVKITQPFLGEETEGIHIPFFIRQFRNFDGERGDKIILLLLRKLYREGKAHLDKNEC